MHSILKIFSILLVVVAIFLLVLLGLLAAKGFLTTWGLMLDLPAQGRIVRVSAGAVFAIVLSIAILGVVMFMVGKRAPRKDLRAPSQQIR